MCLHSKWRGQGGLIKVQGQLCAAVVFGCAVRQSCSPTKYSMFWVDKHFYCCGQKSQEKSGPQICEWCVSPSGGMLSVRLHDWLSLQGRIQGRKKSLNYAIKSHREVSRCNRPVLGFPRIHNLLTSKSPLKLLLVEFWNENLNKLHFKHLKNKPSDVANKLQIKSHVCNRVAITKLDLGGSHFWTWKRMQIYILALVEYVHSFRYRNYNHFCFRT